MSDYPVGEPVTFVVERRNGGGESPSIVWGPLPVWLTDKGANRMVYSYRLDRLPHGAEMAALSPQELYRQFVEQRATGKLPPSNLADPPRAQAGGQKGVEHGEATWWRPTPLPRGSDWTPD